MSLSISSNVASLNVQANLSKTSSALSNSISRLSSGLRISANQDASTGLAQALAARSTATVTPNTVNQAVAMSQTLEGGLGETQATLQNMRSLVVQSLSGAISTADSDTLNAEFSALKSAALNIARDTSFNGESWLTIGSGGAKSITIGDAKLDQSRIALVGTSDPDDGILTRSYDGASFSSDAFNISGASSIEQRNNVLKALDQIISDTSTARAALGTFQGEVATDVPSRPVPDPDLYAPATRTRTHTREVLDFDTEFNDLRSKMLQQAGVSVLSQANNLPQIALSLLRG